ncbi:MAG: hypothetical protein AUG80_03660 [Candidatus Rokubacteria bacterium 13_1_20CM_4_68_9]|nr:MAG: hypothetical protein AUG80_03660 [Candidatus Rokubacteria bacterium 13_1_20CM_4_68_9]
MTENLGRELDLLSGWLSQTAEIERLSARFAGLADAVRVGVAVMTRERVLYANGHVPRILGRSAESLPATPLVRLFPAREVRAQVRAAVKRAWGGTPEALGTVSITRDDGSVCDVAVVLRPLNDLRGPLTAFLGHLTLLTKRSDLPGDLREAFELYRQVTSETLDRFGRAMEWGRRVPLVERVDPETVVTAAVATFETESTPGTVCLELDLAPTAAVVGNADQLQLAIEHVVRNAWESFGGRDGTISMTLEPRGRQVALVVKDNGPGIPDSILPHVFEAFSSTKSISAGLGLGLAIVKDIVDRHQGQVTIESSGAGTTVTFLFDGVDEAVGDGQRATRKRVLLVEDNVAVHETYRLLLEKSGFEVVCATDADEALLLITRDTVDAVVVDVQMAGRDGLALVEALANWHTHLLPKVTLHTAYAYEDRVRAVADRYGIGLLEKPCAWDKLLETVTRLANTQL